MKKLVKRPQDRHGEYDEDIAKTKKGTADTPNVIQDMMLFQEVKDREKATQDHTNECKNLAKKKSRQQGCSGGGEGNDTVQKEVEELQRVMEPKRTRRYVTTVHDDEDCDKPSSVGWDLRDYRRRLDTFKTATLLCSALTHVGGLSHVFFVCVCV